MKATFESLKNWVKDVRMERGSDVIIFIVGNKIDLSEQRFEKLSIEKIIH
jgi:GTPase SAR1 family protein